MRALCRGKCANGFEVSDSTSLTSVGVRANNAVNRVDVESGRELDGDRIRPNGDDVIWYFQKRGEAVSVRGATFA